MLSLIPVHLIGCVPEATMVVNLSGFGDSATHLIGRALFFSREGNAAFVAQGARQASEIPVSDLDSARSVWPIRHNQEPTQFLRIIKSYVVMKLILSISAAMLMAASVLVQVFGIRSDQAVACKVVNGILQTASVGMPLSLLSGMAASATMQVETHAATTHDAGLFHIKMEEGMLISGRIAAIAWSAGLYFSQTDTDLDGQEHSSLSAAIQLLRVSNVWYADISAGSLPQPQSLQEISGEQESANVLSDTSTADKPYWNDSVWITSSRGSWSARSSRPTGDFW